MESLLDKIIVSLIGIVSALITDHLTKYIREKNNNIFNGCLEIERQILEKYLDEKARKKEVRFIPPNRDIMKHFQKNKIYNEIEEYFKKRFNDYDKAKEVGGNLIKKIN